VAVGGLHGRQHESSAAAAHLPKRRPDGPRLYGVPQRGSRAVGGHQIHPLDPAVGMLDRRQDKRLLGGAVGGRQGGRSPVLIGGRSLPPKFSMSEG
jgi:hypothetical protein